MTKAQEQSRMDRISACSKAVRQLLEEFWQESDLASDHLERAKSHLDEAWIDADGQNARTVDRLVADINEAKTLFHAVAAAAAGDKFDIGGRTFVKQPAVLAPDQAKAPRKFFTATVVMAAENQEAK